MDLSMTFVNLENGEKLMELDTKEINKDKSYWLNPEVKICGYCEFTDGNCYTSMPPQVKCTKTGEYHFYNDECNIKE